MNQNFYNQIRNILLSARNKVYQTANFAMVEAYWNIGKSIIEEQGGNEKAEYGAGLLKELSKQMTHDFGKRIYCCKFEKHAAVLLDVSKWLRTA